jgi:hypothetical protein
LEVEDVQELIRQGSKIRTHLAVGTNSAVKPPEFLEVYNKAQKALVDQATDTKSKKKKVSLRSSVVFVLLLRRRRRWAFDWASFFLSLP